MKKVETQNLDAIPSHWLEGANKILDIGCGDGSANITSRHKEWFLTHDKKGTYTGIDISDFPNTYLDGIITNTNISHMIIKEQYDLILCSHILEHIPLDKWPEFFAIIDMLLLPGGKLIIGTPFQQSPDRYPNKNKPRPMQHVVFNINSTMIESYTYLNVIDYLYHESNTFNADGVPILWASLRYLKRRITRNPYWKRGTGLLLLLEKETEQ